MSYITRFLLKKNLQRLLIFLIFLISVPVLSFPRIGNLSGRVLYISVYNGQERLVTRTQLNPGERVELGACDQFIVFGDTNPPTNLAKFSSCDREIVIDQDLKGQRVN
ncbi:hypothetical protein CH367_07815 [Leptospira barantonii]|uniref:Uncharacterized protein n=1 Tax=Leptospira barantonii TaxID=2023184 RepID=A0ABX4NN69_9LEPT|nr:hypothetical protein CH367_07815 [Leptospira barantonii]